MDFITGKEKHYDACAEIFRNTELMNRYSEGEDKEKVIRDSLYYHLTDGSTILAEDEEGRIVGVLMFCNDGMFGSLPYIAELGVREELRGTGIGTALLREFTERCRNNGKQLCFICVSSFNQRAKVLYEREGFRELTLIKSFLKDGIDEYLMMKDLKR